MDQTTFERVLADNKETLEAIRQRAHKLHGDVNQFYDKTHPYSVHLDMAADCARKYAYAVCASPEDVLPIMFGAYFHDSIEDARLTYNNVHKIAGEFFDAHHALMATEIVYALTNEKGRNRAERANDKYYEGIRTTPYAPLCKMADRMANMTYSSTHKGPENKPMLEVYAGELPHFLAALTIPAPTDQRCAAPKPMIDAIEAIVNAKH